MHVQSGRVHFEVDRLLRLVRLKPPDVWHVGETHHGRRPMEWSGFSMVASEAEFGNVQQQIADVIEFLKRHETDLIQLSAFPGVDVCNLDFGIEDRDIPQSDYFPPELLRLAGNLNVGLMVSRYSRTLSADVEVGDG